MTAISLSARSRLDPLTARRGLMLVLLAAAAIAYVLFRNQWTLPHNDDEPLFRSLNSVRDFVDENRNVLEPIRLAIGSVVDAFDFVIESLGWPGIIGLAGALGLVFGGWRLAVLTITGFASLGVLGLWDASMATLGLMLAAVILAVAIGVPLGILAGRSQRASAILAPILDVMQIMPTFAYLTPMTLLFFIGAAPSVVATLIYAIPPAIRITALGIRGVPSGSVEAAMSLGSTGRQVLTKVQLPLARRAIGLGINQSIMMALSMVVITAMIGAPGLGRNILNAVQRVDVGAAFDAGLAIVILAIILDRVTYAAGDWLDPRARIRTLRSGRQRLVGWLGPLGLIGAGLLAPFAIDATQFPTAVQFSFRGSVNESVNWFTDTFSRATIVIKDVSTNLVFNPLEGLLTSSPWWLVVAVTMLIAWYLSGRRASIAAGICLALIVLLGLWGHSMATLANVLVGTALTLVIGIAFGILTARSDRLRAILRPILDAAQTLPAFVYLIPALALFQSTRFTAVVAAVIYAVPPVIRLVDVGIRSVPETVVEAATMSGATERQLLWKVRLPLSMRALLLAANQGIVLVLAMVVIGGLVGAGALGYDVIAGLAQGKDFGKGLAAGIAIVLLGIMLDRITQGAGSRRRTTVAKAG
ncbi:MAG TPA: ABC transporter permease subunit [Candidatus Limnocylindrales bacterium]|nr:ABC transporter permease subunit [Candidatus Limnocylindrales bacterium]